MKQILEAKLISVRTSLEEAYQEYDVNGISYYEGQLNLLEYLLDKCNEAIYSFHQEEYYNSHFDDGQYGDPLEVHNNELAWYKQQEIDDMFDQRNRDFIWWCGKNVMNTDSMWFTSDEIEAFRVIWQRRISHEE